MKNVALLVMTPLPGRADVGHWPTGYVRTNWSQDPFSRGSYSYVAKGSSNRDRGRIGKSVGGRLFFAGEAANRKSGSGVHSAYQSGMYAANEIIAQSVNDVVIIGAGISGLSAAHQLASKGINVRVLEARDRIGGRIMTNDTALSHPVDLGASWVHNAEANPITPLADKLKLKRVPTGDKYVVRDGQGGKQETNTLPNWINEVTVFQNALGADRSDTNWLAYLFDKSIYGDQLVFASGYNQIFDAFKGDYALSLSTRVLRIQHGDSGVNIETNEGDFNAQAVLVTVPLGVLKANDILFSPSLPKAKQRAIERLGFGVLDKLFLQFNEVFWDEDADWILTPDTGLAQGEFNEWLNVYKLFGAPILMGFNGGSPARALASLTDEEMVDLAMKVLQRAYP